MGTKKNRMRQREDLERAEGEGMGVAANKAAQSDPAPEHLLNTDEFLNQVLREYYENQSGLITIEDAAQALVERLTMKEFAKALKRNPAGKLREYMQAYLSADQWQKLQDEELERQMGVEKTLDGATPG